MCFLKAQKVSLLGGFKPQQVPEGLRARIDDKTTFIPCLRDNDSFQLNARSGQDIARLAQETGIGESSLRSLSDIGVMTGPDIRADLIQQVPALAPLFDLWNESDLVHLELTTVGIAIGHAYWRRVTQSAVDLNTWL
jgi:hypothetical protein